MNLDVFTGREDLPTPKQDPDFWRLVTDKNTKKCFVILILNELRRYDPYRDNEIKVLSKLKGFQEAIDLMNNLSSLEDQSLPSDDPFSKGEVIEEQ